ncbi:MULTISPECIES: sensor histidine kinase [unclassified Streptomyces]|uniref:sensor histidine kinase n=1 Tax=unclassified Streptomyces TaxID=2593676 RepID=UPI000A1F604A|nr:sensor histidine kinase [Streptomyces sp. 13-12-16]OSP39566.1 two-component sensor histidine kinase [Streptomyces sp. 13-12-16]
MAEERAVPVPSAWMTPSGRYGRAVARACDIGVALVVLVAAEYYGGEYDLLLGGLMALCLLARRRLPGTVLAAVLALGVVQFVLYDLPDPPLTSAPASYDVAVLFAMMSVVHHSRTSWMPYLAGAVVLLATAAGTVGMPVLGIEPFVDLESLLIFWGLTLTVWLTAFALHTRRLYAESQAARAWHAEREQEQRVRLAATRERAEIARELHDVVAHSLAVMILQADGAGTVLRKSPDMAESALRTIAATGRDAIDDMHRIVRVLREGNPDPGDPDSDGGGPPRRLVTLDEVEVVAERARAAGLTVDVSVEVGEGRLSPAEEMTAFRIVQECLTNVLRHAGAGAGVDIRLHEERGTLLIDVVDDGAGTLAGHGVGGRSGGNGLVGMRERVELAGGSFEAGPRLGSGWHVRASIPTRTK